MAALPERSCDIVMKGGITSGVVYPKAISQLAKCYRFRNIGGTSAGAIAAAAAAAAELGRTSGRVEDAFVKLEELPGHLQKKNASGFSNLFSFFQPQEGTYAPYDILIAAANARKENKAMAFLKRVFFHYWLWCVLGAVPGGIVLANAVLGAMASGLGLLGLAAAVTGLVLILAGSVLAGGCRMLSVLGKRLPENMYGFCSGAQGDGRFLAPEDEALVPWLHRYLNELAGIGPDVPLTFGHLEDAVGGKINLEMFTTCVTWGRPFRLPFANTDEVRENRFYFRPDEFRKYFPDVIVDWMMKHSPPMLGTTWRRKGFYAMPAPRDLPVVVATRMSLSFPVLLSAVPLHAIDLTAPATSGSPPPPRPCWFSDGGLCVNFPLHLFDAPLPRWPTFSINLVEKPAGTPKEELAQPRMAGDNTEGASEAWSNWPAQSSGAGDVAGFLWSLVSTMQGWSDQTLSKLPGYRDRIAHVGLTPDEGGLNLNMDEAVITDLADRGAAVGREFIRRFADGGEKKMNWRNHRWLRMRSMFAAMEQMLQDVEKAVRDPQRGDPSYVEMLQDAIRDAPGYKWANKNQQAKAIHLLDGMLKLADEWKKLNPNSALSGGAPMPRPQLRPRPRI